MNKKFRHFDIPEVEIDCLFFITMVIQYLFSESIETHLGNENKIIIKTNEKKTMLLSEQKLITCKIWSRSFISNSLKFQTVWA